MNYLDLQRGVEWIIAHWPKNGERAWLGWESMGNEFLGFTAGAFMETCNALFRSGLKYAPGPSELMKAIQPIQARRIEYGTDLTDRECQQDNHVWAMPQPWEEDRRVNCVLCGEVGPQVPCKHEAVYQPGGRCAYCPAKGVHPKPIETIQAEEALI